MLQDQKHPETRAVWVPIAARAGALVALSAVLGLTFNSANPIGIAFGAAPAPAPAPTNTVAAAPTESPAPTNNETKTEPAPLPTETTWLKIKPEAPGILFVDVRPRDVYDMGHIPGAICLPEETTPQQFADFKKAHKPDTKIVTYCGGTGCLASRWMAFKLAVELGFRSVRFMPGGYPEWERSEGKPKTNDVSLAASTAMPQRFAMATTWARTKEMLARDKLVLVDARPKPAYDAAHIPGALSLPESSSAEQLEAFRKEYPTNTHLVVYCSSTTCSASKRLADKLVQQLNYANVEFMTGGFLEWQQSEQAAGHSSPSK